MNSKGILVFCNPIVDSFAFVSDEQLSSNNLEKGANIILKNEEVIEVTKKFNLEFRECGGSGMNVARWMAILGYRAAVIGQYGDDERGSIIAEGLNECHVENRCIVKPNGVTTNICICVTPDAQRTMIGIFGASHEKYVKTIDMDVIGEYEAVLIEGYAFTKQELIDETVPAIVKAHELNKKMVMVISDVFMVPGYKEQMLKWIDKFSIITGTQKEFSLLFDKPDLEDLLTFLEKSHYELCAVTMGPEGFYIIHNSTRIFVPAPDVPEVIDTTGAGDSLTAGLLYGYLSGLPMDRTIHIAQVLAGYTIGKIGVLINRKVKNQVEELINARAR